MGHLRGKFTKGVRHIGRAQASLDPRLKSSAWPPILVKTSIVNADGWTFKFTRSGRAKSPVSDGGEVHRLWNTDLRFRGKDPTPRERRCQFRNLTGWSIILPRKTKR